MGFIGTVPVVNDLWKSIFEPGVNKGVILVLHATFIGLICSLTWMLWLTNGGNYHIWTLLAIAAFLYILITWYDGTHSGTPSHPYHAHYRFVGEINMALRDQALLEKAAPPTDETPKVDNKKTE